jgi:hypothetical protein
MKRMWILMVVAACPLLALGQPPGAAPKPAPYQPAVPAPSTVNAYGGWAGNTGGGTVAGSAMNGMASVISAAGDYNLSTSAAAINMTQAQKNEIENRQQYTNTYFEMRATNKQARAAEAGPKPTMEQLTRMAQEGVPKKLTPSNLDPVSGTIAWPSMLQTEPYEPQRTELNQIFATTASNGGMAFSDQMKARQAIDGMFSVLKSQVRDVPPAVYVASREFLQSLKYTVCKNWLN